MEQLLKKSRSLTLKWPVTAYEHPMRRWDGKIRWFYRTIRAIFDESGVVKEYQSVARDTTARKHAEEKLEKYPQRLEELVRQRTEALRIANIKLNKELNERKKIELALQNSKRRYELLFEENPSMYFTIDLKGKILSVNKFGAQQLGYDVDELLGKSVMMVICKEDKKIVQQQIKNIAHSTKEIESWEFRKVRKDGKIIWVKGSARRVVDDNGKAMILIVCEDITEKLKAQYERERLEKRLAEREKLALLGQLAAEITHEINNPLDIIMTDIDGLIEDFRDLAQISSFAQKIRSQVFRIHRLTEDILSYSKPLPPEVLPVDVNNLLIQTIERLQVYLRPEIKIETKLKPALPLILADGIGLEIVFKNTIQNAIESITQQGKILITTQLKNNHLRISVKDNGVGIEKSRLKDIFKNFYSIKANAKGIGLGLAISSAIVKKHRGTIKVQSKKGVGTTFHVDLPVHTTNELA